MAQHRLHRRNKHAPDNRFICNLRYFAHLDMLILHDLKILFEQRHALALCAAAAEENMQRIEIAVFRINAVCSKTSSQTVGAVVHRNHALNDAFSVHTSAVAGNHR